MSAAPVKQLQALLLWCRKEKIQLSHVQLGSLVVQVERDYNFQPPSSGTRETPERKQSIYEQYGGVLMRDTAVSPTVETAEPTEEDE